MDIWRLIKRVLMYKDINRLGRDLYRKINQIFTVFIYSVSMFYHMTTMIFSLTKKAKRFCATAQSVSDGYKWTWHYFLIEEQLCAKDKVKSALIVSGKCSNSLITPKSNSMNDVQECMKVNNGNFHNPIST